MDRPRTRSQWSLLERLIIGTCSPAWNTSSAHERYRAFGDRNCPRYLYHSYCSFRFDQPGKALAAEQLWETTKMADDLKEPQKDVTCSSFGPHVVRQQSRQMRTRLDCSTARDFVACMY